MGLLYGLNDEEKNNITLADTLLQDLDTYIAKKNLLGFRSEGLTGRMSILC